MSERELRTTTDRSQVRDWALVLASEGIEGRITEEAPNYTLWVPELDAQDAELLLRIYEQENERPPARWAPPASLSDSASFQGALAVVTAMVAFFTVTGPRDLQSIWFARGSADAGRIASGELWRSVSALTLHADWAHVASNAALGAFLLTALGRTVGPGVAFGLSLLAGVGGNIVNAVLRSAPHVSVGASTAVFGMVGILSGLSIVRRREREESVRRVALPLAGALAILAMIGTAGDRVDVWAHLFGLLAGLPIGLVAGWRWHSPPKAAVQIAAAASAVAALVLSWQLAFAAV
ncbi:MAG: rhomboid family intramembrane serine protease [Myxococcales bacterium]|nr:rhomboid family intramembrane serine protease [Myxococcales bacterium]